MAVASPTSRNLDMHIRYTNVASIIRDELIIMCHLTGGVGYFPGLGDAQQFADCQITIFVSNLPDAERYEETLTRWRDGSTPLEIWGEPGMTSALGIPNGEWVPIPRV